MIKQHFRNIVCAVVILFVGGARAQEVIKPLNSNLNYIYEDLRVEKTAGVPVATRTQSASLNLPFKDDFYYATSSPYPDQNKWSDFYVYVNSGFPIAPPSIGVATFDGLNAYGYPYMPSGINNQISWPSDMLTSRPINLLTSANNQTLQIVDSIALSFYYQARGNGDPPEISDSLILDFFSPGKNTWINGVWYAKGNINGNINDTVFKRGFVKIDSADYLQDGFMFRFRNYSAATGNYDHWHLDYVYLDKNRSTKGDTVYKDIAFAYVPTPFLRDYSAMPHEQYRASEMAASNIVKIKNNDGRGNNTAVNMTYMYKIDTLFQTLFTYTAGGANILAPFTAVGYSSYAPHSNPAITYTFATMPDSIDYRMKHYIFESGSPTDFIRENDTVVQYQRFRNYYAIDDGSAEAGYYINAAGGKVAIKIVVNFPDSLLAVRIYFDPVATVSSLTNSAGFRINVWNGTSAGPGPTALFTDTLLQPTYFNTFADRAFAEYKLRQQRKLQPGIYYIGIQQRADYMTIGFDMNTDHSSTTFYDSGGGWTQSSEFGSVMIRPVFGNTLPHPVGINEQSIAEHNVFTVYPNPASDQLIIKSNPIDNGSYLFLNSMGQEVLAANLDNAAQIVNTGNLNNGIYLLVLKINNRMVQQQKIIIQH